LPVPLLPPDEPEPVPEPLEPPVEPPPLPVAPPVEPPPLVPLEPPGPLREPVVPPDPRLLVEPLMPPLVPLPLLMPPVPEPLPVPPMPPLMLEPLPVPPMPPLVLEPLPVPPMLPLVLPPVAPAPLPLWPPAELRSPFGVELLEDPLPVDEWRALWRVLRVLLVPLVPVDVPPLDMPDDELPDVSLPDELPLVCASAAPVPKASAIATPSKVFWIMVSPVKNDEGDDDSATPMPADRPPRHRLGKPILARPGARRTIVRSGAFVLPTQVARAPIPDRTRSPAWTFPFH
jgi:hypothetical protein